MAITAPLQKVYDISVNDQFCQRVAAAALDQVATIAAEVGTTPDHANRVAFAAEVAYEPLTWGRKLAYGVAVTNTNIQNALTQATADQNNQQVNDADIKAGVAFVWNFYSDSVFTLQTNKVL